MVDCEHSDHIHVDSGVPQGTVMGPLLYLLYINDLPAHVKSSVRLFADDCLLYRPIQSVTDQIQLQHDLNALSSWADTWGMHFNPAKCYIMSTCPNRALGTHLYSLCGSVLAKVANTKYLGITISEDLQWHEHVATTSV